MEPAGQAPFVPLEADDNKMTEKKRKRHEKRRKMPNFVGPSLSITTLKDFDSKKPYLENQGMVSPLPNPYLSLSLSFASLSSDTPLI